MRFVLTLWLHEVPEYTVSFCRLLLITSCFTVVTFILNIGIHASGKMFLISFISGTLIWIAVPVIYVLLKLGFHPNYAYITNAVVSILVMFTNLFILKHNIKQFPIFLFLKKTLVRSGIVGVLLMISIYCLHYNNGYGWNRFLLTILISLLEGSVFFFFILMNKCERVRVIQDIKGKLWI